MPLKRPYRKGYRNEKKSRKLLEARGYHVIEARGSHGTWDMVALRMPTASPASPDVVLIQCKTNKKASPADMTTMRLFAVDGHVQKLLHIWHDGNELEEIVIQ